MIDLIGQRFGRLAVLKRVGVDKWGNSKWLCRCDCKDQNEIVARGSDLKSGHTKSCGCFKRDKMTKHGHSDDEIYPVWSEMIQRCTNPNHKQWKDYGGRGITVCDEWLHSFPNFKRDNPGWKSGLTLERDKNKLGYFKDNCYWATRKEQQRNRRDNRLITAFGKTQIMIEWSEETGIPYNVIRWRIDHGWTPEKALTTPVRKYKGRKLK